MPVPPSFAWRPGPALPGQRRRDSWRPVSRGSRRPGRVDDEETVTVTVTWRALGVGGGPSCQSRSSRRRTSGPARRRLSIATWSAPRPDEQEAHLDRCCCRGRRPGRRSASLSRRGVGPAGQRLRRRRRHTCLAQLSAPLSLRMPSPSSSVTPQRWPGPRPSGRRRRVATPRRRRRRGRRHRRSSGRRGWERRRAAVRAPAPTGRVRRGRDHGKVAEPSFPAPLLASLQSWPRRARTRRWRPAEQPAPRDHQHGVVARRDGADEQVAATPG